MPLAGTFIRNYRKLGSRELLHESRNFSLDQDLPDEHLPRSINRVLDLSDLRTHLEPYYSKIGRLGLILI